MDSAFEKAKKALTIKSVNLRSSNIFLDYNMEPFELEKLNARNSNISRCSEV